MANSGIAWIDTIFDWAVTALYQVAGLMGITYEEINVWLFCVAWPVVTVVLAYVALSLFRQNRRLRREARA